MSVDLGEEPEQGMIMLYMENNADDEDAEKEIIERAEREELQDELLNHDQWQHEQTGR